MALPCSNAACAAALPLLDCDWVVCAADFGASRSAYLRRLPDDGYPDGGLPQQVQALWTRASRARLASVLACTCRDARSAADARLGAAKRAALGRQAAVLNAVSFKLACTLLWMDLPARVSLVRLCRADTMREYARCDALSWQRFEEQLVPLLEQLASYMLPRWVSVGLRAMHGLEDHSMGLERYDPVQTQRLTCALLRAGPTPPEGPESRPHTPSWAGYLGAATGVFIAAYVAVALCTWVVAQVRSFMELALCWKMLLLLLCVAAASQRAVGGRLRKATATG